MPVAYCLLCVTLYPPPHRRKVNLPPYLPIQRKDRRSYFQCGQTDVSLRCMAMSILEQDYVPPSGKLSQKNLMWPWTTWRSFLAIPVEHPIKAQRLLVVRYNYTARPCDTQRHKQDVGYCNKPRSSGGSLHNNFEQSVVRSFTNLRGIRPSNLHMQS